MTLLPTSCFLTTPNLIYIKYWRQKIHFLEHLLCVLKQIITFASHFRDWKSYDLNQNAARVIVNCLPAFRPFTPAQHQLDNRSLRKHPDYPPRTMTERFVQRWLLGDSHFLVDKFTSWQVNQMARWGGNKLTSRQVSLLTSKAVNQLPKCQVNLFTIPLSTRLLVSSSTPQIILSFSYKNVSWTIFACIRTIIASPLRAFVLNLPPQKMGRKRTRIDINQF